MIDALENGEVLTPENVRQLVFFRNEGEPIPKTQVEGLFGPFSDECIKCLENIIFSGDVLWDSVDWTPPDGYVTCPEIQEYLKSVEDDWKAMRNRKQNVKRCIR
jgi:hypothetical protein